MKTLGGTICNIRDNKDRNRIKEYKNLQSTAIPKATDISLKMYI